MYERFSDRARKVLHLANEEAARRNHEYVGTEHLLLAIAREGSGVAVSILRSFDIDYCIIRAETDKLSQKGPPMKVMGKLPQTPRTKTVIENACEQSRKMGHNYVGTEHLLLSLMQEEDGIAHQILGNLGLSEIKIVKNIAHILGEPKDFGYESDRMDELEGDMDFIEELKRMDVDPPKKQSAETVLSKIKPLLQKIVDVLNEAGL